MRASKSRPGQGVIKVKNHDAEPEWRGGADFHRQSDRAASSRLILHRLAARWPPATVGTLEVSKSRPCHSTILANFGERRLDGDRAMRFLSMIRIDENTGQQPSQRLMDEMGKLMDEMTRDGHAGQHRGTASHEGRSARTLASRQAFGDCRPVHRNQGSDRRLRDPRSQVQGGGRRAHQALPRGPRGRVEPRVRGAPLDGPEFGARAG